jgi:UDP-GlcNAc:undecaprenyl-phosphate GlcNAc-1-phosphate transferase
MVALGLFLLVYGLLADSQYALLIHGLPAPMNYLGVLVSLAIIFITGLIDDFRNLRVRYRLLAQILAAAVAAASGLLVSQFLNPFGSGFIDIPLLIAYPLTIFYLVAFANIINLIDGLDGLAAGVVAISAVALAFLSLIKGGVDATLLAVAVIGACLGFLKFNFFPARIFMGDSGALTLGFALGIISLFGVVRTSAVISLLVPLVIAGIPVLDTLTSIVRRFRAGRSIVDADTEHLHHRFLNGYVSHRRTVFVIYAWSAVLAVCACFVSLYGGSVRVFMLVFLAALTIFLVWRLDLFNLSLRHYYHKRKSPASDRAPGHPAPTTSSAAPPAPPAHAMSPAPASTPASAAPTTSTSSAASAAPTTSTAPTTPAAPASTSATPATRPAPPDSRD